MASFFEFGNMLGLLLGVMTSLLTIYIVVRFLQKGQIESSLSRKEVEYLKEQLREAQSYGIKRPSEVNEIIDSIKKDIEGFKGDLSHLSNEGRQEIIVGLKDSIKSTTAEEILLELEDKIENKYQLNIQQKILDRIFDSIISRLREELYSLTKRSTLNLAIGVGTTLTGLVILGEFILSSPFDLDNPKGNIESLIPRISLVIFIEVFAYFFLRLYKDTLSEIKYFQNEITNIEAKYAASTIALSLSTEEGIINSVNSLLATERNHILNKGQTTVEIEKSKADYEVTNSILSKFAAIFAKSNK